VFDRLWTCAVIKEYIASGKNVTKREFVLLSHPPGHAQADFGEAMVVIGGVEWKAHFFVLDLPYSDAVANRGQAQNLTDRIVLIRRQVS